MCFNPHLKKKMHRISSFSLISDDFTGHIIIMVFCKTGAG